ncbi:hypothetical protein ACJ0V8_020190 [Proteus mirabilis]|uniref:hypothetical protein n=1 Tax=Proteus mirabilis TaxID=584 RepID=UPI003EE6CC48
MGWWGPASISATVATSLMAGGAAMMIGGVAQMLIPSPKPPNLSRGDEEKGNTYFSNLDNAVAQGMPVPIAYGKLCVVHASFHNLLKLWMTVTVKISMPANTVVKRSSYHG